MYIEKCTMCEQQFTTERKKRKYCSQECYIRFREINGSPRTSLLRGSCSDCEAPISVRRKRCGDCSKKFFNSERKRYKMTTEVICRDCGIEKNLDNTFFADGQWSTKCRACSNNAKRNSQRENKQQCVDYKGGRCQRCGYSKSLAALDFHHRDPKEKDFNIAHRKMILNEAIKKELDKCDLLCSNCHREEHEIKKDHRPKVFEPYVEIY